MVAHENKPHVSKHDVNVHTAVEEVYSTLWAGYVLQRADTQRKRFDVQAELLSVLTMEQVQALCLHALNSQEIPHEVQDELEANK